MVGLGHGANRFSIFVKRNSIEQNFKNNPNPQNNNNNDILFKEREDAIRAKANKCTLHEFLITNLATILVFFFHLITLETMLSCVLTVGLTLFWYFHVTLGEIQQSDWSGGGIDWVVLGFGKS